MKFTILAVPFMRRHGENVGLPGRDRARFQTLLGKMRDQMVFAESLGFNGFCMTEQHMQVEGIEATTNRNFLSILKVFFRSVASKCFADQIRKPLGQGPVTRGRRTASRGGLDLERNRAFPAFVARYAVQG